MSNELKISAAKLARFAEAVAVAGRGGGSANPNPDDNGDPNNPFGPYGPGTPVIRGALGALLARNLVAEIRQVARINALAGQKAGAAAPRALLAMIDEIVDGWCGTVPRKLPPLPPRRWPWPWPWPDPPILRDLEAIDLITVGLELDRAADVLGNTDLGTAFGKNAGRALQAGFDLL